MKITAEIERLLNQTELTIDDLRPKTTATESANEPTTTNGTIMEDNTTTNEAAEEADEEADDDETLPPDQEEMAEALDDAITARSSTVDLTLEDGTNADNPIEL